MLATGDLLPADESPQDPTIATAPEEAPRYLIQVARTAMACEFQVFLNAGEAERGTDAALAALEQVGRLEDQLSVYRRDSEVSRLNRCAGDDPQPVEAGLFGLLELCVQLHREAEGAFDITAGPLSKAWGFFRRQGCLPSQAAVDESLERVGTQWLKLSPPQRTVAYQQPGLEINLGGIGKGYALDQCDRILRDGGVESFLIHGGRSSVLASGRRRGQDRQPDGWLVSLKHPLKPECELGKVRLRDRALGTSGSANQFFHFEGRRMGHVLDPRTGWPAEELLSATVLAPTATLADALSTAFFVLGRERSMAYCDAHPDVGAILVAPGQRSGAWQVHTTGLAAGEWLPADDAQQTS